MRLHCGTKQKLLDTYNTCLVITVGTRDLGTLLGEGFSTDRAIHFEVV
jgi:hypothetical protein